MPAQVYWFAIVAFAMIMTLAWLFVAKRITTTGMLAAVTWAYAAITGNDVFKITQTGTEVSMPVGNIQYFAVFMALLSFLAVLLYRWGHYPPGNDDPTRSETA